MRFTKAAVLFALSVAGLAFARTPVTFNRNVLPILQKNCNGCHSPGRLAPMPFTTYEETRPWAAAIRVVVVNKKMPPQIAEPHLGLFGDDGRLTPAEVETILRWVDAGAPEGITTRAEKMIGAR